MMEVSFSLKRVLENQAQMAEKQNQMEEKFSNLQLVLEDFPLIRRVVEETHDLQKKSSEKDVNSTPSLRPHWPRTKARRRRRLWTQCQQSTRGSKKNEREKEDEEEEDA